jgi:hypothetical protein
MLQKCVTSLILGNILSTSPVRVVTTILLPTASKTSTLSVFLVSQGLAVKAYGFDVRAPTGQRSITFPESSERKNFSTYVPTCRKLRMNYYPPYFSTELSSVLKSFNKDAEILCVLYLLNVPEHPYKAKAIRCRTCHSLARVLRDDSPPTRGRRSIGSGGESSSMLTSVEGNAVQGRMLL